VVDIEGYAEAKAGYRLVMHERWRLATYFVPAIKPSNKDTDFMTDAFRNSYLSTPTLQHGPLDHDIGRTRS
jgi:hypothetical protein